MISRNKTVLMVLTTLLSLSAFSASADDVIEKNAKPTDNVSKYRLSGSNFFRIMSDGTPCQLTNGVTDFTIAKHPTDKGMAYYLKDGNMYAVLGNPPYEGQCNKAHVTLNPLVRNVKKMGVISAPETPVVAYALTNGGHLSLRGDSGEFKSYEGVDEVGETGCYGSKKPLAYSKKILLIHQEDGSVYTIEEDGSFKKRDKPYDSLKAFKSAEHVCQPQGGSASLKKDSDSSSEKAE